MCLSLIHISLGFEPNVTHRVLARLEQEGHLAAVVTQNIDGLHQKAGSKRVYELHGSVLRNYCMKCGKFFPGEFIRDAKGIPRCTCGGIVKPDVVLLSLIHICTSLNARMAFGTPLLSVL